MVFFLKIYIFDGKEIIESMNNIYKCCLGKFALWRELMVRVGVFRN
jgi:hypothetical protein